MSEQTVIKIDYNGRMILIRDNFCRSLQTVLRPHTHLRTEEAAGAYMKEISEAINQRLSSEMDTQEIFVEQLRKIWSMCLSKHKSQFWFDIGSVIKATSMVNQEWTRRFAKDTPLKTYGSEQSEEDKRRQKGGDWTLDGALKNLQETDALIASGELNRNLGITLRKIPIKAAERLGADMSAYHAPPMVQAMPKPEPPMPAPAPPVKAEPKPDWDLIVAGSQKPKFEETHKPIDCDVSIEDVFNLASDPLDFDKL